MTGNRKLFSTYKAYNGGNIIFGSNLRGNIIGKGTISNDSLKIDNVEHVDNLGFNLLSIGKICDNKCRVTFSEHDSEITEDGKVIGYSQNSKAYIILNKYTRKVEESLNVIFDETPPPSKTSPLVDDDLDEEEAIKVTEKKNLENDIVDETLEIDEIVNIKESRNYPLENVIGNLNQRTLRSQAQNQSNFFCFISTIEPKNVNEALGDESWIVAMQEELNQFVANDIWELVPQPSNMTIIGTKWVFRNKLDENGVVSRNKARHGKFEISMMGELNFYLGLQIKQIEDGLFFNQSKYIKEMLKNFGLKDFKPMKTPMSSDTKLTKDKDCESVDSTKYRGMIEAPKTSHLKAVKRIFRYIKGTKYLGLWYPKGTGIETEVYDDSDHAGDYVDQKSTSGIYPCEGACVFSDRWSLDELVYGAPSEGPYQTNLPSPDDIISYVREDREGQVTRIRHQEEIEINCVIVYGVIWIVSQSKIFILLVDIVKSRVEYIGEAGDRNEERDSSKFALRSGYKKFKEHFEKEILAFLASLGHSGEIRKITDVNVNKLHQPWRSFAAIINKCLSGKPSYDSLRLSQAQILWGMYNNKKVDYAYLLWEDFTYQIENKNTKKGNAIDDPCLTINVISRNEDTQLYGAILPAELTNEDIRNSESYKELLMLLLQERFLQRQKQVRRKLMILDEPLSRASSVPKAVLTKAEQLKIITKRSRKETHSSHASGSDDDISWRSSEDDQADDKNDDDENAQDDEDDDKNDDDENAQDDEDDDKNDDDEMSGEKSDEDATYEEDQGNEADKDTNANLEGRDDVMTDVILPQVQATQEIEDTHVTLTPVNPDGRQHRSSVSSGFVSNMLNLNQDTGFDAIFGQHAEATSLIDIPITAIAEPSLFASTNHPPTPNPLFI
ncbi:retrovirus-related pol polyprotein from transposon TNT 1-94 [Tanacetum coccineum]